MPQRKSPEIMPEDGEEIVVSSGDVGILVDERIVVRELTVYSMCVDNERHDNDCENGQNVFYHVVAFVVVALPLRLHSLFKNFFFEKKTSNSNGPKTPEQSIYLYICTKKYAVRTTLYIHRIYTTHTTPQHICIIGEEDDGIITSLSSISNTHTKFLHKNLYFWILLDH